MSGIEILMQLIIMLCREFGIEVTELFSSSGTGKEPVHDSKAFIWNYQRPAAGRMTARDTVCFEKNRKEIATTNLKKIRATDRRDCCGYIFSRVNFDVFRTRLNAHHLYYHFNEVDGMLIPGVLYVRQLGKGQTEQLNPICLHRPYTTATAG